MTSSRFDKKGLATLIIVMTAVLFGVSFMNIKYEKNNLGYNTNFIDIDNGDEKINWDRFESFDFNLSETLNITKSGVYHLTGSLVDQNIVIDVIDGKVKLILDNVTIENSNGPAILCNAASDLVIESVGENTLSDGKPYSINYDEDVTGLIYSKADLTFQGSGLLILTANYQDAIIGKDDLKFKSGTYNITARDDAIRGKDSVYIKGGDFTISAKGDGIKSKGFVLIESGGVYITNSREGIEGQNVFVAGGSLDIVASDDGINVSDSGILEFTGGKTYINASGDGVDSNGYIHFNGGLVIIDGPTNNGNGALDSTLGIIQTDGTVIALGSSGMAENLGQSSSIYNISVYLEKTAPSKTKIKIKDASGETIISYISAKAFSHLSVGTPDFKLGETYTIYLNDKEYDSFTIYEVVTVVGDAPETPTNQRPIPNQQPTDQQPARLIPQDAEFDYN